MLCYLTAVRPCHGKLNISKEQKCRFLSWSVNSGHYHSHSPRYRCSARGILSTCSALLFTKPSPPRTTFSIHMVTPNVLNLTFKSLESEITETHANFSPTHTITAFFTSPVSAGVLDARHIGCYLSIFASRNFPIDLNSLSTPKTTMCPSGSEPCHTLRR